MRESVMHYKEWIERLVFEQNHEFDGGARAIDLKEIRSEMFIYEI